MFDRKTGLDETVVIDGKEFVTVLDQLGNSPLVFDSIVADEEIEGNMCLLLRFRRPDILQLELGF